MATQELNLEKVLSLVPMLKDYGFSSFVLVDGELNTVSDSIVPVLTMDLAEEKIMNAIKDGYFCDAVLTNNDNAYNECDCSGSENGCDDCQLFGEHECDDFMLIKDILDNEYKLYYHQLDDASYSALDEDGDEMKMTFSIAISRDVYSRIQGQMMSMTITN